MPASKTEKTEVYLTTDQINMLTERKSGFFIKCLKNTVGVLWGAVLTLITSILTLKDTGKWVSVLTLGFVLYLMWFYLNKEQFNTEAMKLVIPYLGQIATLVFGIIGGFKGANSLIDKVKEYKVLSKEVVNPNDLEQK